MNTVENILAAIIVLGGLVTFHELGHYWAARWCGVHVMAFSFGFGKPLLVWRGRKGTRFMLSALPLGGYVRLLEQPSELDDPAEQHGTIMAAQPCWKRAIIVAAGPAANFLLAWGACWLLFLHGITGITPVIGAVAEKSWAAQGGLTSAQRIEYVNATKTLTWPRVQETIRALPAKENMVITTADGERHAMPPLSDVQRNKTFWEQTGIVPWQPAIPPVVGQVLPDSPAARAGLAGGARIEAVNNVPIDSWEALLTQVRSAPAGRAILLKVQWPKERSPRSVEVWPEKKAQATEAVPVIGIQPMQVNVPWPDGHLSRQRYSLGEALLLGGDRTWSMCAATVEGIWQLATGAASPRNLGGPVMIARVAGDSARSGLEAFLGFFAYLSVSLGVFNLLPIPMLDGGQLLFLLAEAVKGRPLSLRIQLWGRMLGVVFVSGIMIMALYFDLTRV